MEVGCYAHQEQGLASSPCGQKDLSGKFGGEIAKFHCGREKTKKYDQGEVSMTFFPAEDPSSFGWPFSTYLFRKIELTSSWVIGGFFELAAIRRGRRNTVTRALSCLTYSSSHSTMPKMMLLRLRMLSAWSERMYSSTICFHLLRHSQPRKKLWTWREISKTWRQSAKECLPGKKVAPGPGNFWEL